MVIISLNSIKYFILFFLFIIGNAFLQQVLLDKHLGNQTLEIVKISNGYELFTVGKPVRISISIDTDVEDFSVLEIGRKMNNNDVATDCVALGRIINYLLTISSLISLILLDHSNIKVHWYGASTLYEFSSAFDERYWLNSLGVSIYIEYDVPLFVDGDQQLNNHICFTAKAAFPYSSDNKFNFKYKIGFSSNARKTHINAMNHFFEIPKSYPDENLIKHLIWSTHGIFGRSLTQDQIHNFMNEAITKLGIHSSMLIIDDGWESCYGSLAVDETKFPNMKNLITIIKTQFIGMKVELYVRPIIESSCKDNFNFAKNNNYLVKSATGSVFMDTVLKPDLTKETTHIDFSNPDATKWFKSRLEKLKAETGADGFKFAWGSQIHLPSNTKPQFNKSFSPNILTSNFVKMAAELGSSSVVRAGWKTQDQNLLSGIAINYSKFDGMPLILMIPTWIQMNMIGYPFILTGN